MPDVTIPLGTKNINKLIRQLKKVQRGFENFNDTGGDKWADEVASYARQNIASIRDPDGNFEGLGPENIVVLAPTDIYQILWRGDQIAYLEFGTGALGAAGAYPIPAGVMYRPDPTKQSWWYYDIMLNGVTESTGLAPQAPMFRAATRARQIGAKSPAIRQAVKDILDNAFTS